MSKEPAESRLASAPHPLQNVLDLCAPDMRLVDAHIRDSLRSEVVLVNQVANYIISGGGKRLRPMLLILAARSCQYAGQQHIALAAIIEFIHTATLLHDDVVDESDVRRGRETAHAVWGNAASVLVGDFLYSRSFQMMVGVDSMRVMDIMSEATNTIAEGEVLQLLNLGDPEISESAYFNVIRNKTAKLFEAACRLGGVIAGCDEQTEQSLARFGNCLGMAFQVADDVLDYDGDGATMGKNIGDDLSEGKPTLPLIHARAMAGAADLELIDRAIREGGQVTMQKAISIVHESGALVSAMNAAMELAEQAEQVISALPDSPWSGAMRQLARYAYQREN